MKTSYSIRDAFVKASSFLASQGVVDHVNCSEILLQHALSFSRTELLLHWNERFPVECIDSWEELIQKKALREPVQYITGEQEFYGLPIKVNRSVLIPRPETELLVEAIIHEGSKMFNQTIPCLADIGTGSGAISIALAKSRPEWRIVASDISSNALQIAKSNAKLNHIDSSIRWLEGDLLDPHISENSQIHILVANLPYISLIDMKTLEPEVRDFEPKLALYGGGDGLELYRRLMRQLNSLPQIPNLIGIEVGLHQAEIMSSMLEEICDWNEIKLITDLAGIQRHVIAIRNFS